MNLLNPQNPHCAIVEALKQQERECERYDCFPFEIKKQRERPCNRRKEQMPYLIKHFEEGNLPSQSELNALLEKYNILPEDIGEAVENSPDERVVDIDLQSAPPDLLEDLIQLLASKKNRPCVDDPVLFNSDGVGTEDERCSDGLVRKHQAVPKPHSKHVATFQTESTYV